MTDTSPPSTPGATPSATAAPDKLTTTGLATGPAPKIPYAVKGRLVLPDGGGFALPKGTFDLARLGDLTVVMVSGSGDDATVEVLDADGTVVKTDRSFSGALVVNDAHDVVTWLGVDGEPRVLDRGGDRIVSLPAVAHAVSVVDINGYLDCQEEGAGALGGCTALVNADDGARLREHLPRLHRPGRADDLGQRLRRLRPWWGAPWSTPYLPSPAPTSTTRS